MEMLKHYIRAPEAGPIAFSRRRGFRDEKHRRRFPKEGFYGVEIVTVLSIDELFVDAAKVLPRLITQRVSDRYSRCHLILRSHNAGKKYGWESWRAADSSPHARAAPAARPNATRAAEIALICKFLA